MSERGSVGTPTAGTPLRGVRGRLGEPPLPRWRRVFCLVLLLAPLARAHDIYSSWCEAKVLADKLEVTLTLARSSAHDLLPDAKKRPAITPDNFAEFAPRLQQIAAELLPIANAGKPLPLKSAQVKISGDADITFTLVHAPVVPGKLRLFAAYVGHLVDGHVATLGVTGAGGEDLGWSPVTADQPAFEITLPSSAAPKK